MTDSLPITCHPPTPRPYPPMQDVRRCPGGFLRWTVPPDGWSQPKATYSPSCVWSDGPALFLCFILLLLLFIRGPLAPEVNPDLSPICSVLLKLSHHAPAFSFQFSASHWVWGHVLPVICRAWDFHSHRTWHYHSNGAGSLHGNRA